MERSWPIGKRYEGGVLHVRAPDFEAYADATDDRNARYRGAGAVAPPMFHVRLFIDLMMQFARDGELDINLLRLVHGEHDVQFFGLLCDGDAVTIEGDLVSVTEKSSGRLYSFGFRGSVKGRVLVEGTTTYFVRGEKPASSSGKRPAPDPLPEGDWTITQAVAEDQADRYAPASGDLNPIHTDPEVARKAGLPGVILHGLCTMAFAQRDIIERLGGGDPGRLKRLAVRWAAPVFPGSTLELRGWGHDGDIRFVTLDQRGRPVMVQGRARLGPS